MKYFRTGDTTRHGAEYQRDQSWTGGGETMQFNAFEESHGYCLLSIFNNKSCSCCTFAAGKDIWHIFWW